ncbi:hypothetical protein GQ44DRAFT_705027 [Phaeosphaeriaceae sp. PMI808]|nr:hypothetical protein GQ44DRAFT_705027 [Phaeosphaeriaceae sp. PMI808]
MKNVVGTIVALVGVGCALPHPQRTVSEVSLPSFLSLLLSQALALAMASLVVLLPAESSAVVQQVFPQVFQALAVVPDWGFQAALATPSNGRKWLGGWLRSGQLFRRW